MHEPNRLRSALRKGSPAGLTCSVRKFPWRVRKFRQAPEAVTPEFGIARDFRRPEPTPPNALQSAICLDTRRDCPTGWKIDRRVVALSSIGL